MERKDWRQKLLDMTSWHADVDEDFVDEVNRSVLEPAYKRLASEVPEALIPDTETVTLLKDRTSTSMSRVTSATSDEYVMTLGTVIGDGEAVAVDGTWDGIYHIEIYRDGVARPYRYQCREFWIQSQGQFAGQYLVSLDRPWNFPSDTGMTFRLYQPYFYTRDDVSKIQDGRLFANSRVLIRTLPAGFARYTASEDYLGQSVGPTRAISRWTHFQMPAPSKAPGTILSDKGGVWSTTMEPPGTFRYCYTYVWGRKTEDYLSPGGSYDPLWESAPSPESEAFTIDGLPSGAINVSGLPNIDWQQNFDPVSASLRNSHSGWRKRIYRARDSVVEEASTINNIEADGVFYFLAEIDGAEDFFEDDGTFIPEYARRLPESHGYWSWSSLPHQDDDYELDLRVTRRPAALQSDTDAPQVHPEFEPMLLELGLAYLYNLKSRPNDAKIHEDAYKDLVNQWRAQAANPADVVPAIPWVPDYVTTPLWYYPGRYTSS